MCCAFNEGRSAQVFKTLLESAWTFGNWLTHTKSSKWHDAEAVVSVTENGVTLCISAIILHVRGYPTNAPRADRIDFVPSADTEGLRVRAAHPR
jgi:hypothetical protein